MSQPLWLSHLCDGCDDREAFMIFTVSVACDDFMHGCDLAGGPVCDSCQYVDLVPCRELLVLVNCSAIFLPAMIYDLLLSLLPLWFSAASIIHHHLHSLCFQFHIFGPWANSAFNFLGYLFTY
ncbi:hypothetical protein Dimus_038365 [Dionaea muscipula]